MIKTKNLGILKAIGELERLSLNNPLRLRYEAYLKKVRDDRAWRIHVWKEAQAAGREEGKAEGRAEGKAEGKAEGRAEGKAEGRAEGKAEGKAEDIIYLLETREKIPDSLKTRILEEKDVDKLQRWLVLAARSKSAAEFQKCHAVEPLFRQD